LGIAGLVGAGRTELARLIFAADPQRLGDERQHWGSYYESQPWVHVGNIRAGFIHLRNMGLFSRLGLPTNEDASNVA
jgi:hypothetical protein